MKERTYKSEKQLCIKINKNLLDNILEIQGVESLHKHRPLSNTIRLLLWLGVKEYQKDEKYQHFLALAKYKAEHGGLLPYQYDQAEIDSAFSMFDTIE